MGQQSVLHGDDGHHPAEEHEGGVDLTPSQRRLSVAGEADGQDDDAGHRRAEPEQDAGVSEGAVH